jgi:hypothetical protein
VETLVSAIASVLAVVLLMAIFGFFYLIPTVVAFARAHPHRYALFLLNTLLGWSGIVWFGALIWALAVPVEGDATPGPEQVRRGASPADRPPVRVGPVPDPFTDRRHPLV